MSLFKITVTEEEKNIISACLKTMFITSKNVNPELTQKLNDCIFSIEHCKEEEV